MGEIDRNRQLGRAAIASAAADGAELVVLPELCTSGYAFESTEEARALAEPSADSRTLHEWRLAAGEHGIVVVGGFCELGDDGLLYDSAAVVDASGTRAVYRKTHLWDREKLFFAPGTAPPPVVATSAGRIGLAICYELWFPEVIRGLARRGAQLVTLPLNTTVTPRPPGERAIETVLAMAAAHVSRVFVATCDRCGEERGLTFSGGSAIAGPDGWLLAEPAPEDAPATVIADCDLALADDKALSERNHVFADLRESVLVHSDAGGESQGS